LDSFTEPMAVPPGDSDKSPVETGETTAEFSPQWRDNLVAYLDGELSEQDMQQLDEVLVSDPLARTEVDQLRQTWDLLDVLPRPVVTEEFSAQTMASIQAIKREDQPQTSEWPRRGLFAAGWLIALSVSAIAGVLLADRLLPDPTDHLLEHLSVIERLDVYSEIGNAAFLQALADTGRFPRDTGPVDPQAGDPQLLLTAVPAEQRKRSDHVAALSQERRRQLKKNLASFNQLADSKRLELERLDRKIVESSRLATVAHDFHDWLKTLQPWQRDTLRQTSENAKKTELAVSYLEAQIQVRSRQPLSGLWSGIRNIGGPRLSPENFTALITVIETHLKVPAQQLETLEGLTGSRRSLRVLELSVGMSSSRSTSGGRPKRSRSGQRSPWPGPELAKAIRAAVKDEAVRKSLAKTDGQTQRQDRIYWLIVRGLYHEWLRDYRKDQPSNRQLQEVFVELSTKDQDQLMRLPTAESQKKLRIHYFRKSQPGDGMSMLQRIYRIGGRILSQRGGRSGGLSGSRSGSGRPPPRRRPPANGSARPGETR
ncbi:MAG: hypothetical protein VB859_12900, partial [Planctomycetaceae bacterium]